MFIEKDYIRAATLWRLTVKELSFHTINGRKQNIFSPIPSNIYTFIQMFCVFFGWFIPSLFLSFKRHARTENPRFFFLYNIRVELVFIQCLRWLMIIKWLIVRLWFEMKENERLWYIYILWTAPVLMSFIKMHIDSVDDDFQWQVMPYLHYENDMQTAMKCKNGKYFMRLIVMKPNTNDKMNGLNLTYLSVRLNWQEYCHVCVCTLTPIGDGSNECRKKRVFFSLQWQSDTTWCCRFFLIWFFFLHFDMDSYWAQINIFHIQL